MDSPLLVLDEVQAEYRIVTHEGCLVQEPQEVILASYPASYKEYQTLLLISARLVHEHPQKMPQDELGANFSIVIPGVSWGGQEQSEFYCFTRWGFASPRELFQWARDRARLAAEGTMNISSRPFQDYIRAVEKIWDNMNSKEQGIRSVLAQRTELIKQNRPLHMRSGGRAPKISVTASN